MASLLFANSLYGFMTGVFVDAASEVDGDGNSAPTADNSTETTGE